MCKNIEKLAMDMIHIINKTLQNIKRATAQAYMYQ